MLNRFNKRYSGQAVAIVMVVLVVATIIGASVYSRMLKNQQSVVETRESTMAIEQANSILDIFTSGDLARLQTNIATCLGNYNGEEEANCEYTGLNGIRVFFLQGTAPSKTGGDNTFLTGGTNATITDWCDDSASNSSLTLRATYADIYDYLQINVGEVMAINTKGLTIPVGCTVDLGFKGGTTSAEVFTIKKVYKDASDNVKPYAPEDMLLYCIGDCITPPSQVAPDTSVESSLPAEGGMIEDIPLGETIGAYSLYELRVLPLKGGIQVSVLPNGCGNYFYNYRLESEVKCKGESRAVAVIIPNIHNTGYLPLFDYTIYNGTGSLSPN